MARKADVRELHQSSPSNTDPPKEPTGGDFIRWIAPFLDPAGLVVVPLCLSAHLAGRGVADPVALTFIYGMSVFSICAYIFSRFKK
jgi:hypothetical protein